MQSFDATVCDASRDLRPHSVNPLQALAMYNGSFVAEEARHFAERLQQLAGPSQQHQIDLAFRIALGREPATDEVEQMQRFMEASAVEERLPGLCRILLNSSEFCYLK
jgi:hypothetical protein